MPMWERLADHISTATISPRLSVEDCLQLLPKYTGDTALEAASSLASSISQDKERRGIQGFLLLSLCIVLDMSGRATREKIDSIIEVLTKSSKPRYLDTLKRGARVANEIIAEWAGRRGGDHLQQLDQATQAVLQARLSAAQWGALSEHCTQVKERVVSRPLPQVPAGDGCPVLIPPLISHITKGSLKLGEVCRYLGYSADLSASMVGVSYETGRLA
ncbi:hypothetical protein F5883DRAFT_71071 [Diaporthe sp. PMI_573]|nr:hypothetical protein F5883DRAFT_71071 [Diaporthaceae sp. PMI_573]